MNPDPKRDPIPRLFLLLAAVLAIVFFALHALGWRSDVGFFSGTLPIAGSRAMSVFRGVTYVLGYLGFVLAAPTLVIAAALMVVRLRIRAHKPGR